MADHSHAHGGAGCSCCSSGLEAALAAARRAGVTRRHLIVGAGSMAVGAWAVSNRAARAQEAESGANA